MPNDPLADAELEATRFDFEPFIRNAVGIDGDRRPAPDICTAFLRGTCPRDPKCTLRHGRPNERRTIVVCKHWLRSLCKKGEGCEFLHEMNASRMPTCYFFQKYGECINANDCPYLHIDWETQRPECPWYMRGFCRQGPRCKFKHVRKRACAAYLCGFCPHGPACPNGHARFEIMDLEKLELPVYRYQQQQMQQQSAAAAAAAATGTAPRIHQSDMGAERGQRPLSDVVCFKCGTKGHYANRCTVAY